MRPNLNTLPISGIPTMWAAPDSIFQVKEIGARNAYMSMIKYSWQGASIEYVGYLAHNDFLDTFSMDANVYKFSRANGKKD